MVKVASGFPNFLSLTHLNLYEGGGKKRAPTYAKRRLYWASWSCSLRWRLAGYEETVGHCDDGWQVMRKRLVKLKILWTAKGYVRPNWGEIGVGWHVFAMTCWGSL